MSQAEHSHSVESQSLPLDKKSNRGKRLFFLFIVPAIIILGALFVYLHGGRYVETDNAYVQADKTNITAEVSGRVISVAVEENQEVKEGQVLLKIDPMLYQIAVQRAKANLNDVKTSLKTLQAEYQSKLANIDVSQAQYDYAKREEKRQRDLLKKHYTSTEQYDQARQKTLLISLEMNTLKKGLKQVEESLGGDVNAPVEQHPKYQQALAELDKAQNDLQHIDVIAPADGVVSKVIEKGQYVAPGSITMMLIANHNQWIEANFTENDLTYMRPGQPVEISVDSAPGYVWHGKVASLSPATGAEFSVIPAQNATGNWVKITQRVPVRIAIESANDAPQLRAGLSTLVTVDTSHKRTLFGLSL